jgi:DNA-binding LytR/AlgR family response regulator
MTYRRDSSDSGVIVRHSPQRPADVPLRHVIVEATMAGLQPTRTHATLPAVARGDLPFTASQRPTRAMGAAAHGESGTPASGAAPEVILVKSGFRQVATRVREIVYVEAARNYVRIHLETGPVFKSRVPIDRLALHLGHPRFLRIHRGCLVNVERIRAVNPLVGGRLLLTLSNGAKVTVARDRRRFVLAEIGNTTSPRS